MLKNPIIIDTDPGIDDAVALVLALKQVDLNIVLLSSVSGNVGIENTTANLIKLKEFLHVDIPVCKGASTPLSKKKIHAKNVHGLSGMDGYDFPTIHTQPIEEESYEAMHQLISKTQEKVIIIALAPLTNIALLLEHYPQDAYKIEEIVMMGGTLHKGNITEYAEYNIYADAKAFDCVLKSNIKMTLVPLEVTHKAVLHKKSVKQLEKNGKTGEMLACLLYAYKGGQLESGLHIHDALAVTYVLKPDIFQTKKIFLNVSLDSKTEGKLDISQFGHPINYAYDIETEGFEKWLIECLK